MTTLVLKFDYMEDIVKFYFSNSNFRSKYDDIIHFSNDMHEHKIEWKYNYINICELEKYELPNHMLGLCSLYLQCDCCDLACKLPLIKAMLELDNLEEYMDNIILPILRIEYIDTQFYDDLFELELDNSIIIRLIEAYDLDLSIIIYYAFRYKLYYLFSYVLEKSCFGINWQSSHDKKN